MACVVLGAHLARGACEEAQVVALPVGEAQRSGHGNQDALRDVAATALLQPHVVVEADAGELGEFLAPESRHPPAPEIGQPDVTRLQASAA